MTTKGEKEKKGGQEGCSNIDSDRELEGNAACPCTKMVRKRQTTSACHPVGETKKKSLKSSPFRNALPFPTSKEESKKDLRDRWQAQDGKKKRKEK